MNSVTISMPLMGRPLFSIRLIFRRRSLERLQSHCGVKDPRDVGKRGQVTLEGARVDHLRDQTDVGQSRQITMTEAADDRLSREKLLHGIEPLGDPMLIPALYHLLRLLQRIAQILQHSEVVQGMNIAGDDLCESPYTSAPRSITRQQCRGGLDLVQIFDDRERLANRFGVGKQRQYQSLGIEAQI